MQQFAQRIGLVAQPFRLASGVAVYVLPFGDKIAHHKTGID
jgi:hypothetical protein